MSGAWHSGPLTDSGRGSGRAVFPLALLIRRLAGKDPIPSLRGTPCPIPKGWNFDQRLSFLFQVPANLMSFE